MMFLESPWPILVFGIIAEAVLAVALVRTGRGIYLAAMAGVAIAVLLGVLVERLVVTDRKLVAQTIDGAAAALEANDLNRVLQFVSPTADDTRERARQALGLAEFVEVKVRNLEIAIVRTTSPPTAKATFTVWVTGKDRRGDLGQVSRPVGLVLHLRLESGRWLIADHRIVEDPREM